MDLTAVTGALGRHVRDAVVITEAEPIDVPGPRIVWVNDAFCQMTGYSAEEAIGETPRFLQGPDTDVAARARIREALIAWRPIREILKNYTKDGRPFWIELDIKPIADETGWYRYWVAVQRDVTEHVARQNALEEACRAAEKANAMKSDFLANMSHEIRTPLNGALGMAQVLALTDLDPRQRRAVDTIISSGQSLLALIEDVMDIARIESGRLILEPGPTTARTLLTEACDAVRGLAISKGLELRVELGAGVDDCFEIDARRARQVLINLAGNAAKFTDSGEIVLSGWRDGARMIFEVCDSGPGIEPELRDKIFERFQQGAASRHASSAGLGLGLAIAREIVVAAGGAISVGVSPQGGARFTVEFPVGRPGVVAAAPVANSDTQPGGRRALVIEDNAVNRMVVSEALTLSGWRTVAAENAQLGLAAWNAGRFDLVIMDRHMPGMNGEAAIRRLREEETAAGLPKTPVLMLTAHALSGAEADALAAGADAYMAKPIDLPRLISMAEELARA